MLRPLATTAFVLFVSVTASAQGRVFGTVQQLTAAAQLEQSDTLDEAIAAYRDILAHVPALTSVHLQLGVLFERKHENASAVSEYQAALKADPANTKARAALERLARQ